jgi:hypothetical protein
MAEDEVHEVVSGAGYAVGNIDALGEGGGFRKIRPALGVQALGINVIVMPAEFAGRRHYHYEQEETYFIHQGQAELEFGNAGANELIYLAVGGKDGYVENDGHLLPSEETA